MSKYKKEYIMSFPYGNKASHMWTILGAQGGKHLSISGYEREGLVSYSGGLETHWRHPPDHMRDEAPADDKCFLLHQPCWHDGTSLYVSERIIPMIEGSLNSHDVLTSDDHVRMFNLLKREMEETFGGSDDS